jgi:catechol 2,3-dioxygenase-like lactoylglutathione lyase family enzyme
MRALGVVLFMLFPISAWAQPASPISATGAFFGVSVTDMEASTRWYQEKLGLSVVMRVPRTDQPAVHVLEGGGLIVELVEQKGPAPQAKPAPPAMGRVFGEGIFKAGVIVTGFDATIAALRSRGVEIAFGPFPARPGQRANAIIKDNAGNLIQLFGS